MEIGQKLYKMKINKDITEFEIIKKSSFEDEIIYTITPLDRFEGFLDFKIIKINGNIEFYKNEKGNHFLLNPRLSYLYKKRKEIKRLEGYNKES